jgi:transcriptional regulator with XRE-family HTH domain
MPASVVPTTTYAAVVGRLLEHHRKNRGLTQQDVAEVVGMTPAGWSRVERGEVPATIELLAAVAETLGVTPGQLLQEADRAHELAQTKGIDVVARRADVQKRKDAALGLLGAAAVAGLVAAAINEEEG